MVEITEALLEFVRKHEGFSPKPYLCPAGKLTIGYGHNLDAAGISRAAADFILIEDLKIAIEGLRKLLPELDTYTPARQMALIDMVFNMGIVRFAGFRKMLKAIQAGEWETAAFEAQDSQWFKQVGNRADEIVNILRTGT
jgi:lysozyme